jgi:hypothetical protein
LTKAQGYIIVQILAALSYILTKIQAKNTEKTRNSLYQDSDHLVGARFLYMDNAMAVPYYIATMFAYWNYCLSTNILLTKKTHYLP